MIIQKGLMMTEFFMEDPNFSFYFTSGVGGGPSVDSISRDLGLPPH